MHPPLSLAQHLSMMLDEYLSAGYGDDPEEPPQLSPMQHEPTQSIPSQGDPLLTSIDLLDRAIGDARGQAQRARMTPMAQMPLMPLMAPTSPMTPMGDLPGLPNLPDLLATDGDSGFDFLLSPAGPQHAESSPAPSHADHAERSGAPGGSERAPSPQLTPSPWTFSASPTVSRFPAPGKGLSGPPASDLASAPGEAKGSLRPHLPLQGLSGLLLEGPQGPKFPMPKRHPERQHPYQRQEAAKPPQPGPLPLPKPDPASGTVQGPSQAMASQAVAAPSTTQAGGRSGAGSSRCSTSTHTDAPSPATSDSATLSSPNTPHTPDSPPGSPSPSASRATLTTAEPIPVTVPHSPHSPPSPHSPYSWSSRASSETDSRASLRNSQSESAATRSAPLTGQRPAAAAALSAPHTGISRAAAATRGAPHTAPSPDSTDASAGPRLGSGAANVAAAVALERMRKQSARLEAVMRLPLDQRWPAGPAADFFQAAVSLNGWPEDLAIHYLDFTVHPPLRRVLQNATSNPPATTGALLPISITRHADGHLDAGLSSTPSDLRRTVAATPLGHLDAITCGLRWIHYGVYEQALSALLGTLQMPLGDLKRELNAQGHPVGSYAIALKAIAVTVRSQTAMQQLQLSLEQGQLLALTGQASRHPPPRRPSPLPEEVIKIE